jgi:hypothetical protein
MVGLYAASASLIINATLDSSKLGDDADGEAG